MGESKKNNRLFYGKRDEVDVYAEWVNHDSKGKWLRIVTRPPGKKEKQLMQLVGFDESMAEQAVQKVVDFRDFDFGVGQSWLVPLSSG